MTLDELLPLLRERRSVRRFTQRMPPALVGTVVVPNTGLRLT